MKPRSHSLNHVVWVTMTTIAVAPTISVARKAMTWRKRLVYDITAPASECLPDAEVHPEAALLRLPVDEQSVDRIQLIADVEPRRTDRRLIAEAWTHRPSQIGGVDVAR